MNAVMERLHKWGLCEADGEGRQDVVSEKLPDSEKGVAMRSSTNAVLVIQEEGTEHPKDEVDGQKSLSTSMKDKQAGREKGKV